MSSNFYEQPTNDSFRYISAIIDEDGTVKFTAPSLSSANFDGYIPTTSSFTAASALMAGDYFSPSGSVNYYQIIRIEKEQTDWLDVGEQSGIVDIYYLDADNNIISASMSASAEIYYIREQWFDEGRDVGTSGWTITSGGNAIFANVAVRGRIEATEGYIGNSDSGWEIGPELLSNASVGLYAPSVVTGEIAFFAGAPFESRASAVFRVGYDGKLNASSATISGALVATTLDVGGANGIVYNGSAVTIGASVNILAPVTVNSLQVGASPTLLRISDDVNGTNDGIYINANNYWYSDGQFGVGSASNNVVWTGSALTVTGDIYAVTITASNGNIAGFTLSKNQLSTASVVVSSSGGLRLGGNPVVFSVDQFGNLIATSASITGNIVANSGTFNGTILANSGSIGGWILNPGLLAGTNASIVSGGDIILGSGQNIVRLSASDSSFRIWAGSATASVAPFRITTTGGLIATSASITGNIVATSGSFSGNISASTGNIGGWQINNTFIAGTSASIDSAGAIRLGVGQNIVALSSTDNNRIWAGSANSSGAPFIVTSTGGLVATSASITGNIVATSGSFTGNISASTGNIGGWVINNTFIAGTSASIDSTGNIRLGTGQGVVVLSATDSNRIWAGSANSSDAPFKVSSTGLMTANGASITGDITAINGRFRGQVLVETGGSLKAGTGAQNIFIDSTGLYGYNQAGLLAIKIPTDGTDPLIGKFKILETGIVSQHSQSGANIIVGEMSSSATTASVLSGIVLRGYRSPGASIAMYNVVAGSATTYTGGNGFYIEESGKFKLKGTSGSLVFDGSDIFLDGNINARSGKFSGSLIATQVYGSSVSGGLITGQQITGASITGGLITGQQITGASVSGGLITGGQIVGGSVSGTIVSGASISGGFITGQQISGASVTGGLITGGQIVGGTISGASGTFTGNLFATNLSASAGDIGGFVISATSLTASTSTANTAVGITTTASSFFAGSSNIVGSGNAAFWVSRTGSVFATAANITGTVVANSGSIGGWLLSAGLLAGTNASIVSGGDIVLGLGQNVVRLSSSDSNFRLWAGSATASLAPFRVTASGGFVATTASIIGDITANSGRFTGSVSANSGSIGGWVLNPGLFAGTNASIVSGGDIILGTGQNVVRLSSSDSGFRIWSGSTTASVAPFRVSTTGALVATTASIIGDITANSGRFTGSVSANSGSIGGWVLNPGLFAGTNASIVSGGDIILGTGENVVRLSSSDANFRIWSGSTTASVAPFRVTTNGILFATAASIVGDSIINGTNIGTGGGNSATNLRIGQQALSQNTTGILNIAVGPAAMYTNRTGRANVAIGASALFSASLIALSNIAIGDRALAGITETIGDATLNVGIGGATLYNIINSDYCIAIGASALFSNTIEDYNIAIGVRSMGNSGSGVNNIGIGLSTLRYSKGDRNIAIGDFSMGLSSANGFGSDNIAIGRTALGSNKSFENIAVGTYALANNTTGSFNLAIGSNALSINTTGYRNISLGFQTLYNNTSGFQNIAIGDLALINTSTSDNNVAVGTNSMNAMTSGDRNVALGGGTLAAIGNGSNNLAVGHQALNSLTSGQSNIAIGARAALNPTSGNNNIYIGYSPGATTTSSTTYIGVGDNLLGMRIESTRKVVMFSDLEVATNVLYVDTTNNEVGINTAVPASALHVIGGARIDKNISGGTIQGLSIRSTNNYTTNWNAIGFTRTDTELGYIRVASAVGAPTLVSASDYRLKKNIESDDRNFTSVINNLRPVTFEWKDPKHGGKTHGFIAHEVQPYIPEAVGGDKDAVDENGKIIPQDLTQQPFVYYLVGAFKESIKEIESLKAKVLELESKIYELGGKDD